MLKAHKNICKAMLLEYYDINSGQILLEQGRNTVHHVFSLADLPVVLEKFFKMVFKGQASVHGFLPRPQKATYSTWGTEMRSWTWKKKGRVIKTTSLWKPVPSRIPIISHYPAPSNSNRGPIQSLDIKFNKTTPKITVANIHDIALAEFRFNDPLWNYIHRAKS